MRQMRFGKQPEQPATKVVVLGSNHLLQVVGESYQRVHELREFAEGPKAPGVGWVRCTKGWVPAEYLESKQRKPKKDNSRRASRCRVVKSALDKVFD